MLDLKKIENYYPKNLRAFKKNILREYLQYEILEIIFNSKYANTLSFLGGTALRILYDNTRFSEDLDFDNFGLSEKEFSELTDEIKKELEKQGYVVEIKNVFKGAFRCYIKLPGILFDNELSFAKDEKIIIQIDTVPQEFDYKPEKKILNKFDIFTQINVTPIDLLLSQKIYATLNRKRAKGRDFFDVIFLLQKAKPNYEYLQKKIGIGDGIRLKEKLMDYSMNVDFEEIANDVAPFLFNPNDSQKIKLFADFIRQVEL
ncbi:MAG: hypothetical protein US74_C0002G0031 [Parcubacteria group bacterium GW2011_GWA2_38_13]|nr:MAG: hypothetical protein US74_C0002G0031 [Parcubacteria group bacterium GW2011_GWA2_38_13]